MIFLLAIYCFISLIIDTTIVSYDSNTATAYYLCTLDADVERKNLLVVIYLNCTTKIILQ
jgi:hypothetical protein